MIDITWARSRPLARSFNIKTYLEPDGGGEDAPLSPLSILSWLAPLWVGGAAAGWRESSAAADPKRRRASS